MKLSPRIAFVAILVTFAPASMHAQRAGADSALYARARQLVVSGNGAAGRMLVDSMLAAAQPETPAFAEALYWRAALATTSEDAERDYTRLVVEYPLFRRTGDALLQLAQLELARGDRAPAIVHLQRFLFENPRHPEASRASLLLVRAALEVNDAPVACRALTRALAGVDPTDVELRNQLDYYASRCRGVDTTRAPITVVVPPTPHRDSSGADAAAQGRYTLQLAAYNTRADADRLVKRLAARDIEARVVGTKKPFRVQVGRYATRAAAAAAARKLAAKKIDAFVTEIPDAER